MTSVAEETAEQERWRARLRRPMPAYDRLLANEFDPPDAQHARAARKLGDTLRLAALNVPYYRNLFGRQADKAPRSEPLRLLSSLPVLTKQDVRNHRPVLMAERRPAGEGRVDWRFSSGTTGRPVAVLHSFRSTRMFSLLKQREYRWFRLNPAGTFAAIRLSAHLPRGLDGREARSGETVHAETWPYLDDFVTGPFLGISAMTPAAERIAWLNERRPDYLMAYSETLEHLAFAARAEPRAPRLEAMIAISEQLTPGMRSVVEHTFGGPVHQNYGLNEIGLVAARCESGRYHVHSEHCYVEIVDDCGNACAPDETGRIVVTGLSNYAMPLIRYDTSDLAEAVAGPCACGRSLPSFGQIVGRYSRAAYLPPGIIGPVLQLRSAIEDMPALLTKNLREFQIHHARDNHVEVRVVTDAPMPDAFLTRLRASWTNASGRSADTFSVRYVDAIERSPGGKFQVFISDFMPPPDR